MSVEEAFESVDAPHGGRDPWRVGYERHRCEHVCGCSRSVVDRALERCDAPDARGVDARAGGQHLDKLDPVEAGRQG